jgi:hypothetical protein
VTRFRDSSGGWVRLGVSYEALLGIEHNTTKEQVQLALEERSKRRLQVWWQRAVQQPYDQTPWSTCS